MNSTKVYISGLGILSALGNDIKATEQALRENRSGISPLQLFPVQQQSPLPTAEVTNLTSTSLPRTHTLALAAAKQAMSCSPAPPDAVILGTTTGGILTTEQQLAAGEKNPDKYKYHGLSTVAQTVAEQYECTGKAFTVSTACSSGAVALTLAMRMLQAGEVTTVLAGGVDSLCYLTYYGFHSLQLVDQEGSKPFDIKRQGMSVGEGSALLLLTTDRPEKPLAELSGAGLSCDAYHAAAPHPEGAGAYLAMHDALQDGQLSTEDIDYINLHGTGTPDNDLAESKAIRRLFPTPPPLSSVKGATGHSLAASGAIEAAIATIAIQSGLLPANTGLQQTDPELHLQPLIQAKEQPVAAVLSNSFGFGGNNASLLLTKADLFPAPAHTASKSDGLTILGKSCITGAGKLAESMASLLQNKKTGGQLSTKEISATLPGKNIRRLKRYSRLALALANDAFTDSGTKQTPENIFMGTGWGALSETYDFLKKLRETNEQFPSPIDFVGSVHNSAAGQIAILFNAQGANITSSGGDYSFEQALNTAESMLSNSSPAAFVLSVDEGHPEFSTLFDPSIEQAAELADGGGCFHLTREQIAGKVQMHSLCYQHKATADNFKKIAGNYDLILAGIPAAYREEGEQQLTDCLQEMENKPPVLRYRELTGEFASASAVAAVMAVHLLEQEQPLYPLENKRILLLGLGNTLCATSFSIL